MEEEVKDMVAAVQYYVENRVAIQHQITAILNEADTAAGMFASGRQLAYSSKSLTKRFDLNPTAQPEPRPSTI